MQIFLMHLGKFTFSDTEQLTYIEILTFIEKLGKLKDKLPKPGLFG